MAKAHLHLKSALFFIHRTPKTFATDPATLMVVFQLPREDAQHQEDSLPSHLPNIVTVDPGDEDLPLVVVDEQSSNHCGCLSVPTGHGETKSRLRRYTSW